MENKWILLIFALLICSGFGYYIYTNTVSFEITDLYGEKEEMKNVEYTNGNRHTSKTFKVHFNLINSKETHKEINGVCILYDNNDNVILNRSLLLIDFSGDDLWYQFDNLHDEADNVSKFELIFYNDNGDEIYHNISTNIIFNETLETGQTNLNSHSDSKSNSDTTYWGSSKSNKFHYTSCDWAQKISSKNKVVFHSIDEAINSGYQPCGVCCP